MIAIRTISRRLAAAVSLALAAAIACLAFASPAPAAFEIASFDGGLYDQNGDPVTQAGSHPDRASTLFKFTVDANKRIEENMRDVEVNVPAGLVGNPTAMPKCTYAEMGEQACPQASQVGTLTIYRNGSVAGGPVTEPLYNMEPRDNVPAQFAARLLEALAVIEATVRTNGDYGLKTTVVGIPTPQPLYGIGVTFWGVPADHNGGGGLRKPFLALPTSCLGPQTTFLKVDTWQDIGNWHEASFVSHDNSNNPIGATGCEVLDYNGPRAPSLTAHPTTNAGDAPSGLEFDLHLPQDTFDEPEGLVEPNLKDTTVTLPPGLVINPAAANGLGACGEAEFGFVEKVGDVITTTADPATCPDASKIGTVEVETPVLDHAIQGAVYLAKPNDNPFDSMLALYITINDPKSGVVIKLAGKVEADPQTGRLTTTVLNNPQLPFSDFILHFKQGAHAALRTPAVCGTYQTTSSLTPWSAPDSGPPATPSAAWQVAQRCANNQDALPNAPELDAGSVRPVAAASTPMVVNLRREDGTQEFSSVKMTLPPGLTGKLAGVGQCPDDALAAAASRSGKEEEASPSCPASSRIGRVDVAAGAGPDPYNAVGTAYLTGPYKGAPLSMAVVTPATAGPFDLGTVVVRVALYIDHTTGQITAVSDEIPHILKGIQLDVRSARVLLDRSDFTRNGTSCDPMSVDGSLTSILGQVASLSQRFQLGECSSLAFKPKLGIRLFGGTKRGAHPRLRAVVRMPEGGANVARASVALPHSEFLDQGHIGTVCTRVQFAQGDGNGSACPPASIYGHAVGTSPLVDYALTGNAYLRSSSHELPDLVIALNGPPSQPVKVELAGRVDSVNGGIRTTFEQVPDLPVSTFVLNMKGGRKGLLQNSTDICAGKHRATAVFNGQNGKAANLSPALRNGKCPKSHGKKRHHRRAVLRHLRTVR